MKEADRISIAHTVMVLVPTVQPKPKVCVFQGLSLGDPENPKHLKACISFRLQTLKQTTLEASVEKPE